MRIPTGETTYRRDSLPDPGRRCQARMLGGQFRLQERTPFRMPMHGVNGLILDVVTHLWRGRSTRCCGRAQETPIRLEFPGPVPSFQQVRSAMVSSFAHLPPYSFQLAIHIHQSGGRWECVTGCNASANRSLGPRRCVARRSSSNWGEIAGRCSAWQLRNGDTSAP